MNAELILILVITVALFGLPFWAKLYRHFRKPDEADKQPTVDRDDQNPPE